MPLAPAPLVPPVSIIPVFGRPYIQLRDDNSSKLKKAVLPRVSEHPEYGDLLRSLCTHVLDNDDFLTFPASVGKHHYWNGGLVDHTIEVIEYCAPVAKAQSLDVGVMTTAALWHDFAKIKDYAPTVRGWETTPHYKRIRHVVGSVLELDRAYNLLKEDEFPELHEKLIHIMLSHHGRLEWGSPVLPQCAEALLLHQADYFSAQEKCCSYTHDCNIGRARGATPPAPTAGD